MNIARLVRVVAGTAIAALALGSAEGAQDYASLAKYPDFTGFWIAGGGGPPGGGGAGNFLTGGAPLKPELAERLTKLNQSGVDPGGRDRYCSPFGFTGNNASFTGFDIVFSPGRMTLINEEGLIRRIYIGRRMPKDAVDSLGGTSVAQWRGRTLVVETAFIDPQSKYPAATVAGAPAIGRNAHITEWFTLEGRTLQIRMTMTAPQMLTGPFTTTRTYQRDEKHWPIQRTSCVDNDRLVDPVTGFQRFDLTPPSDIPPPPSN